MLIQFHFYVTTRIKTVPTLIYYLFLQPLENTFLGNKKLHLLFNVVKKKQILFFSNLTLHYKF